MVFDARSSDDHDKLSPTKLSEFQILLGLDEGNRPGKSYPHDIINLWKESAFLLAQTSLFALIVAEKSEENETTK